MEDKLFCDRVAKGELSKNDILKFAESVEDKVHLCWLLFCRMPFPRTPQGESECERLNRAIIWIETKYGFDWDYEYEQPIKTIDEESRIRSLFGKSSAKAFKRGLICCKTVSTACLACEIACATYAVRY